MASRSSAIVISSDSEDGLCMDCACILENRMHSMHAHGLCMHTATVARYTKKVGAPEEKMQAANISQLLCCQKHSSRSMHMCLWFF